MVSSVVKCLELFIGNPASCKWITIQTCLRLLLSLFLQLTKLSEPIKSQLHEDFRKRKNIDFLPVKESLEVISSKVIQELSEDHEYF